MSVKNTIYSLSIEINVNNCIQPNLLIFFIKKVYVLNKSLKMKSEMINHLNK